MEMVIIAIFVAVMFGYIFANSEGIDLYLQTYSADMAIIINTMLSGSNEMELTYQMPSGYNAEIKNNEICVYYQQPPISGVRSFVTAMYKATSGKANQKCEFFVQNPDFEISMAKYPGAEISFYELRKTPK